MISSLQFLLTAMQALKKKNPLTESFIVQLDLDLAGAGIDVGQPKPDYYSGNVIVRRPPLFQSLVLTMLQSEIPRNTDAVSCSPIFEIRDSQNPQGHRASAPHGFGNHGLAQHSGSTFGGESAPPPYYNAGQMNMSDFAAMGRGGSSMDLPHRQSAGLTPGMPGTVTSLSPASNSNEMDTTPDMSGTNDQPTPSTTASRQGSSSHTSYNTPPSNIDPALDKASAYATAFSTATSASSTALPLGTTTTSKAVDQSFYPVAEAGMDFPDMNTHFFSHDPANTASMSTGQTPATLGTEEFSFPPGWDISMGGTGGGTGLSPITEPNWTSMMDGWEGMGPPHTTDAFGRRV